MTEAPVTASPAMPGEEIQQQNLEELAKVEPLPQMSHVGTIIVQQYDGTEEFAAWISLGVDEEGKWVPVPPEFVAQLPMVLGMLGQLSNG